MSNKITPVIDFKYLSLTEAINEYPVLWETVRTTMPELDDDQVRIVISLVVDTCPACHEDNASCQCWNDE